jgi:hypothetical protein
MFKIVPKDIFLNAQVVPSESSPTIILTHPITAPKRPTVTLKT